jgi:hypothetical protein
MEEEHEAMKTTEQGIVKFTGNAGALRKALIETDAELVCKLTQPKSVERGDRECSHEEAGEAE